MMRCLASFAVLLSLAGAAQAGPQPFVGETTIFPLSFCPRGYVLMDGSVYPIRQFISLYSLLGNRFGGDGVNTFAVPKANTLYTVTRATLRQCIAFTGVFPQRP